MDKKTLISVAIASAIVGFLWSIISFNLKLSTVAGFIAWSSFFAAGGNGLSGVKKGLIANISGTCWGAVCAFAGSMVEPSLGTNMALSVTNGCGAFGIIVQSKFSMLACIPAAFLGWSALIASNMDFGMTILCLACGSLAGFTSEKLSGVILGLIGGKTEEEKEVSLDKAV